MGEKILTAEIQSLSPSAMVEMFILDSRHIVGGSLDYFHSGTNGYSLPLVWQGKTYQPLPIEAEGFDISAQGQLPRPQIRIANINGLMSATVMQLDDLLGSKLTRKRTFARYLDAVNFPSGNPTASATSYLPDQEWIISQKTLETRQVIEFEMCSAFDFNGVVLPRRQVIQNTCSWAYRGAECGYTGGYFDEKDQPTTAAKDTCQKRLASCKARQGNTATLTFGGFPGVYRER